MTAVRNLWLFGRVSVLVTSSCAQSTSIAPFVSGTAHARYDRDANFTPFTMLEHTNDISALSGVVTYWWSTTPSVKHGIVLDYWIDGESSPSISVKLDDPMRQGLYWVNRNPFHGNNALEFDDVNREFESILKHGRASGYYGQRYTNFTTSIRVEARTLTEEVKVRPEQNPLVQIYITCCVEWEPTVSGDEDSFESIIV